MRHLTLLVCAAFAMTACVQGPSNTTFQHSNPVPDVNLKGDALKKYQDDVTECQRQVLKQYGDKYGSNNAISDLRSCLINKGYVLLS